MKRILFLVSSMEGGGAERVAALLCNHWAKQGHQVTLMPTFSGKGKCQYVLDKQVKLDYLADRIGTTRQSFWNKIRRILALRRIFFREKPDVVVSFLQNVNVAATLAGLGTGVPIVVSERIYPPAMPIGFIMEWLRCQCYPLASTVVMQTKQGLEWLMVNVPKARCQVIPNPVVYPLPASEPKLAPNVIIPDDRKFLLAAGRLVEQKGFDRLIMAFSHLAGHHNQWDLVILGEGERREALEKEARQLGIESRVFLPGQVGNMADWYNRASLYVMSSHFEGFPNTLVEAMAHGLAVVSIDCETGPRDIIRHDIDGLLVSQDDGIDGLISALDVLMADQKRRREMALSAVDVRLRFSMKQIAIQWDRVLGIV